MEIRTWLVGPIKPKKQEDLVIGIEVTYRDPEKESIIFYEEDPFKLGVRLGDMLNDYKKSGIESLI